MTASEAETILEKFSHLKFKEIEFEKQVFYVYDLYVQLIANPAGNWQPVMFCTEIGSMGKRMHRYDVVFTLDPALAGQIRIIPHE